jgi:Arc/MetJ-type ribon-helix-helix transcriptional regulator
MEIRLRPELEDLIKQDVQRGSYASINDFVEHAVSMLHEQEAWLTANRGDIQAKIEEGYAAAQRGELLSPGQVRSRLAEMKRARSGKSQRE